MRGGHDANGAGDFTRARLCFLDAYASSPTAVARISAANMALKMGEHSTARAEYDEILRDTDLSDANRAVREACACGVRDALARLGAVGNGRACLCGAVRMYAPPLTPDLTWQVALRKLAEALLANSAAVAEAEATAQAEAEAAAKAKADQEADQAAAAAQLAAELAAVEAAVSSTGSLPRGSGRPPLPPRGRSSSQMMRHATLTPEAEAAARHEQQAEAARQAEPPPPPPPPRSPRKERQPSSEALSSGEESPKSPRSPPTLGATARQMSKKSFVIKQVMDEKGVLRPLINEDTGAFQMASMEAEQLACEKEEVERLAIKAKTELEKQKRVAQEAQERAAALAADKAKAEAELSAARRAAIAAQDKIEVLQAELVGVRRDAATAAMQRETLRAELAETQAAAAEAGAIEVGGLQSGAPGGLTALQLKLAEAEEEKAALRRALDESQQQLTLSEVERWQFSVEGAHRAPSESDASDTYLQLDLAAKQVAEGLQDSIATQEARAKMLELELEAAEKMAADAEAAELDAGEVEEARAEVARLQKQVEAYEAEDARREQERLHSPLKWFTGVGGGSRKVQQPPAAGSEGDSGSGEGQQGSSVIGANVFRSSSLQDLLSPRFGMCMAPRKPSPKLVTTDGDAAPEASAGASGSWQIADDDDSGDGVATGGATVATPVQRAQRDWVAKQEAQVEVEADEEDESVATVTAVLLPSDAVDVATEPKPKQMTLPPRRPSAGRGSASPWASTFEPAPASVDVVDSAAPPPPPRRMPTKDVAPPQEILMGSQSL
tara:strand:- start:1830 stop:4181 length:2352 start_codon:yes stop_codon:yes gene_type:complete